jgi:very-short-patch-repair endonuclease
MAREMLRELNRAARALARRQHWVITRAQLLVIGYSERAIEYRIEVGWLHRIHAGVYAVDREELTLEGGFIAAVLACGEGAALSHESAAQLWQIRRRRPGPIHVSVPEGRRVSRPGIKIHRRTRFEVTRRYGIPVTTPVCTIVDVAAGLTDELLERAVNEAINRDLVDPERLRVALDRLPHRRGARRVRALLDRDTFVVTDTMLEQRFLPIARAAGLPKPETQAHLAGGRVDFYWPELKLIVEADSLRFHRTPAQQLNDRLRDQRNAVAGLTTLRFTHSQIWFDTPHVCATLERIAAERSPPTALPRR